MDITEKIESFLNESYDNLKMICYGNNTKASTLPGSAAQKWFAGKTYGEVFDIMIKWAAMNKSKVKALSYEPKDYSADKVSKDKALRADLSKIVSTYYKHVVKP